MWWSRVGFPWRMTMIPPRVGWAPMMPRAWLSKKRKRKEAGRPRQPGPPSHESEGPGFMGGYAGREDWLWADTLVGDELKEANREVWEDEVVDTYDSDESEEEEDDEEGAEDGAPPAKPVFRGSFYKEGREVFFLDKRVEVLDKIFMEEKRKKKFEGLELLIEVRDARIPKTSTHPFFTKWCNRFDCPRMIVYSRADILTPEQREAVLEWTRKSYRLLPPNQIFFEDLSKPPGPLPPMRPPSNAMKKRELRGIWQKVRNLIRNRPHRKAAVKYAMVVGIRNSGKTNFSRKIAGHTRPAPTIRIRPGMKTRLINKKPLIHVADTIGIYPPSEQVYRDKEGIYKLSVCGAFDLSSICVPGQEVDLEEAVTPPLDMQFKKSSNRKGHGAERVGLKYIEIIDYLLFKLNQEDCHQYVDVFNLPSPTENVQDLLQAVKPAKNIQERVQAVLSAFNKGQLGSIILDDLSQLDDSFDAYPIPQAPQYRYGYLLDLPDWAFGESELEPDSNEDDSDEGQDKPNDKESDEGDDDDEGENEDDEDQEIDKGDTVDEDDEANQVHIIGDYAETAWGLDR